MVTAVRISVFTHIAALSNTHACNQSFLPSTLMYHLIFPRHNYTTTPSYYTHIPLKPTVLYIQLHHPATITYHHFFLPPTLTTSSFYHTNTYSHTFLLLKHAITTLSYYSRLQPHLLTTHMYQHLFTTQT